MRIDNTGVRRLAQTAAAEGAASARLDGAAATPSLQATGARLFAAAGLGDAGSLGAALDRLEDPPAVSAWMLEGSAAFGGVLRQQGIGEAALALRGSAQPPLAAAVGGGSPGVADALVELGGELGTLRGAAEALAGIGGPGQAASAATRAVGEMLQAVVTLLDPRPLPPAGRVVIR